MFKVPNQVYTAEFRSPTASVNSRLVVMLSRLVISRPRRHSDGQQIT
jgi:hypothetical protein